MSTTMTRTQNEKSNQDQNQYQELSKKSGRSEQSDRPPFFPRFDIWEGEDELILYGDLPGVSPDDLDINFDNRMLTIHGKVCRCHDDDKSLWSEYGIGNFYRTFTIGEAINSEGINAELRDGVLKLHLPKSDHAKPRRIKVKAS